MFRNTYLICIIIAFWSHQTETARILGVFPTPAISHQSVFRAYTQELARKGHELVIITTNPTLPKNRPADNVTEVDISFSYEAIANLDRSGMDHGVIFEEDVLYNILLQFLMEQCYEQFQHPGFKKILENKEQHFDLIVLESVINCPLAVTQFFKAPVIQISTYYGASENYETVGAPARHPMLYPDYARTQFGRTFWSKLKGIYQELSIMYQSKMLEMRENVLLKSYFGPNAPTVQELRENVDMLFVNLHPILAGNRPVPPSVVFLGSLHLQPVKELPKDLKAFLDNSKRGVVYVSFGTNVPVSMMDRYLRDLFMESFGALEYDVIWKFDKEIPKKVPKNLMLRDWFPQRDLLAHPNIQAFVTQGGQQSSDEAIDAGVPMVGIPYFGDQAANVHRHEELGISIMIDPLTFTKDELVDAVKRVAEDKRNNVEKLRSIMRDQPESPIERAMWWTEHLLRHKGGRHLRSPGANMSWTKYFMLDVIGILLAVVIVTLTVILTVLNFVKWIFYSVFSVSPKKVKSS